MNLDLESCGEYREDVTSLSSFQRNPS